MSREIIDVCENHEGVRIFFEDGESKQCCNYRGCELLGFNQRVFVVEQHGYYLIVDSSGNVCGRIQSNIGRLTSVSASSIVLRDRDRALCYDMQGNLKNSYQVLN